MKQLMKLSKIWSSDFRLQRCLICSRLTGNTKFEAHIGNGSGRQNKEHRYKASATQDADAHR